MTEPHDDHGGTFTQAQLQQLRQVLREEISDAGLRLDDADHVNAAREDFRFVRKLRTSAEGISGKIGWAVIAALISALVYIVSIGINAWNKVG